MEYKDFNILNVRKKFKELGIFYTPDKLAKYLKTFFDNDVNEVYDPTCGRGNLLKVFGDEVKKYGQELNKEELEVATKTLTNFTGASGDTLTNPYFNNKKFKAIVSNIPFSIKWEPIDNEIYSVAGVLPPRLWADYAFILHIIDALSDDGKACVIINPGILSRGKAEYQIRRWLIEENLVERVEELEPNSFVDSPLMTYLLVLNKAKTSTDITMKNVNGDEKIVTLEEVKNNNYDLTVVLYIEPKVEYHIKSIDEIAQLEKRINQIENKCDQTLKKVRELAKECMNPLEFEMLEKIWKDK